METTAHVDILEEKALQYAIDKIYINAKTGIGGNFAAALFIFLLLFDLLDLGVNLSLFLAHLLILTGRTVIVVRYFQSKKTHTKTKGLHYWLRSYQLGTLLSGIVWGGTFFCIGDLPTEYHFILFTVIVGLSTSGLLTLGVVLPIYFSFILPMFLLTVSWMIWQHTTLYLVTALITVLGFAYYYYTAQDFFKNFKEVFLEREKSKAYVEELEREYNTFETLFEKSPDGVIILSKGRFLQCNQKIVDMLQCHSKEEVLQSNPMGFFPRVQPDGTASDSTFKAMITKAKREGLSNFEWVYSGPHNENLWADITLTPITLHNRDVIHGIIRDISDRKRTEQQLIEQKDSLNYQAHHDPLTKLPNRTLFNDRLEHGIAAAKRTNKQLAVLFIDLDHFKQINDSLGHTSGDKFLQRVTERLCENLRDSDTLARVGGDEFTIIMERIEAEGDAASLAQKILGILSEPFDLNERILYISCSIGISLYPKDGQSVDDLVKYADTAMYKAKEEGRNNFQFYRSEMTRTALERVAMVTSLQQALKKQEFEVYYHPQLNIKTQQPIGCEALIRWHHPTKGLLTPSQFVPLAEDTGLIIEIDNFMMRTAMAQVSAWYQAGLNPGIISLNLTLKQLESEECLSFIRTTMEETGCHPAWLEFEVTESQMMKNSQEVIDKLHHMSALGIKIAIDDFGTGYSSLSYLKYFPINKLKIDHTFIEELPEDREMQAIVQAIITLAKSLALEVLAEGVLSEDQVRFLSQAGCDTMQGDVIAPPMQADETAAYLAQFTLEG